MSNSQKARPFLFGTMAAACLALSVPAHATVMSGSSSSYAESVALDITPLVGVEATLASGPLPSASGSAPAPYSQMQSALSVAIGSILSTGVLNANASSNIDGSGGVKFASADASVAQLGLNLLGVLGIGATTIASSTDVSGDYGALSAIGTTTIAGLTLNGVGILTVAPTVNDVLLDLAGIRVVLNEQTASGDGTSSEGIGVNALHISFTDVPYLYGITPSLLNGDIILSHSQAYLSAIPDIGGGAVPEPATLAVLGSGLACLFGLRRKRVSRN